MRSQHRIVVGGWWLLMVVACVYFALAIATSRNVSKIRNKEREQRGPENALIATTMLSALQVAIYMVLSAFVLLGRWCSAETHVGLWFGVIIALAFSLVFGFLPAALMLWGFLDEAKLWENSSVWSIADTMQLRVTSGFAFLSAILYFVYAWVLLFCKKAFQPEPAPSLDATLYAQQPIEDSGPV